MTVPTHFRFTVRGDFVDCPEHFSFGFKMSRDVATAEDAKVDDIDQAAVTTALTTLWQNAGGGVPTGTKVMDWRAYEIGTDGLMQNNPLVVDTSALTITGAVAPKYPPQIALCVTTVAANRGPARFGRFYLPTALAISTDKRITTTLATNAAEAVTQFLKSVSDAIGMPLAASSTGVNVSTRNGGVKQAIDHIEVGRVLDTLRTRRNSMLEERVVHGHIDW